MILAHMKKVWLIILALKFEKVSEKYKILYVTNIQFNGSIILHFRTPSSNCFATDISKPVT